MIGATDSREDQAPEFEKLELQKLSPWEMTIISEGPVTSRNINNINN
jgi:hypothetical protein